MKIETFLQEAIERPTATEDIASYRLAWRLTTVYFSGFVDSRPFIVRFINLVRAVLMNSLFAAALWIFLCALLPKTSLFLHSPLLPPFLIFLYALLFVTGPYLFFLLLTISLRAGSIFEQRIKENIVKKYGGNLDAVRFSPASYLEAARALEAWNAPLNLEEARAQFSQESVDICILAGAVLKERNGFARGVSLNAIRQDREAGWED